MASPERQNGLLLFQTMSLLIPCATTFRDKLLFDGSQSIEHKGFPPSRDTMAENMPRLTLESGVGLP